MGEISFVIGNQQAFTIRLDPTDVRGGDVAGQPVLRLPLKLQLLPRRSLLAGGKEEIADYVLLRLAGTILSPPIEFAGFEAPPLAEASHPSASYYRPLDVVIALDRPRIKRFEDARSGANAQFQFSFSVLIWFATDHKFERVVSQGYLEIVVPKSHWADEVVSRWNLSVVRIVEIVFPKSAAGEHFTGAYSHIEAAEKHFANGLYKQTLTELRLGFEALAKGRDFDGPSKEFFESLFRGAQQEKKEKAAQALLNLYRFLHMGPHKLDQPSGTAEQSEVSRRDARFALTMAHAVFEYITPRA